MKTELHQPLHEWIAERSKNFTPGEYRLAKHLNEHPELWAFESAAQLATRLETHRSSIVRFAQRLGLKGFPALQTLSRNALLKTFSPSKGHPSAAVANEGRDVRVDEIYQRELVNLRQSYERLNAGELDATARGIAGARNVFLFGRRFSYPVALYLSLALNTMRGGIRLSPEPGGSVIDMLFDLTPQDFALVVSMRRHSPEVQRTLSFLDNAKVPHVLLTDVGIVADQPRSMRLLQAYVGSNSLLDSYTALASISRTLLIFVSEHLPDSRRRLEDVERAWSLFNR